MSNNKDQVFPISLSEIAFTLVFLLMLLMGYMIHREQKEKTDLQEQLKAVKQTQSAVAAQAALDKARVDFEQAMAAASHPSPQDITKKLVEASDVQVERDRLRKEIQDLNGRMTAMEALRQKIEKVGASRGDMVTREEIEQALNLQEEIRKLAAEQSPLPKDQKKSQPQVQVQTSNPLDTKQAIERVKDAIAATNTLREQAKSELGIDINPGEEPTVVRQVVEGAKVAAAVAADQNSPGYMKTELEKLRGQIQYFTNRDKFRGLDHPPCWADANGKIEYLFTVETRPDGFITTKAWPANREQDARSLPNIDQALIAGIVNRATFAATMQPILDWSKKQDPECRHFVHLATTISNADDRDNSRKFLEGFFYKLEVKR